VCVVVGLEGSLVKANMDLDGGFARPYCRVCVCRLEVMGLKLCVRDGSANSRRPEWEN